MFYTYVYLDPRKPGIYTYGNFCTFLYEPFYIGKGREYRIHAHLQESRLKHESHTPKARKIKKLKLLKYDLKRFVIKLNKFDNEMDCLNNEIYLISLIGRKDLNNGPLVNLTDGGDGSLNVSDETKNKLRNYRLNKTYEEIYGENKAKELKEQISIRQKGKDGCRSGYKHSEETKKKLSIASSKQLKGKDNNRYGIPLSDEIKEKMSKSRIGKNGIDASNVKYFKIISPTNEVIYFCGDFVKKCKELGLKTPKYMTEVAKGIRDNYKGWKCEYITKDEYLKVIV